MDSQIKSEKPLTSRPRAGRWWFPLAAVAGILSFGYLLAEGLAGLGLVDYRVLLGTLGDEPWRNPINRLDPDLLHVHKPHQRIVGVMTGGDIAYYLRVSETHTYPYEVRTDRDGFRNDQDLDQADIVVIGDSYTEGILVPQNETMPAELGRLLEKSSLNLGQIWYGPQQEEVVFRRYALPRRPKVVVWCYFEGNDLKDMNRYAANHVQWDVMAPKLHSFKARSLARNLAVRLLSLEGPQKERPLGERNVALLPDGQRMYFFYRNDVQSEEEKKFLPEFEEILTRVWKTCQDQQIRFVFAYVPIKVRVYDSLVSFPPESVFRNAFRVEAINEMKSRIHQISSGITFVDLTPALVETSKKELTYYLDDTHWTPAGHRAAAEAIAKAIRAD